MTVENVLERTVVRAAAPGGGAEAAGVETGSLLVALDGQSTKVRGRDVCRTGEKRCARKKCMNGATHNVIVSHHMYIL